MSGRFNLADYETVDQRIHKFWDAHPQGRITTALIGDVIDGRYIFRADIYRDASDTEPAAVGWAEELQDASPVNKTHPLENCETSAIGRALANLGLSKQGARPSQEEMTKPIRQTVNAGKVRLLEAVEGDKAKARVFWKDAAATHGVGAEDEPESVEQAEAIVEQAIASAAEQVKMGARS